MAPSNPQAPEHERPLLRRARSPIVGGTFRAEDDGPAPRGCCSTRPRRRRFGADRAIAGRLVRLNGVPYLVGVVADAVKFSRPASIWTLSPPFPRPPRCRHRAFDVVARLKPGVTMEAAHGVDVTATGSRTSIQRPTMVRCQCRAHPRRHRRRQSPDDVVVLLGVVGVVPSCRANVANLLLARTTARGAKWPCAPRGAGRGRIVRQLLTESLVLAAAGGLLGMLVGAAILRPHQR